MQAQWSNMAYSFASLVLRKGVVFVFKPLLDDTSLAAFKFLKDLVELSDQLGYVVPAANVVERS